MPRKSERTSGIDKRIGENVKRQRVSKGYSRHQFCKFIGVTHQQLAKYENGNNRISAGRLYIIAEALTKSVSHFYESEPDINEEVDFRSRICMEVSRNFAKLKSLGQMQAVNVLIQRMGER